MIELFLFGLCVVAVVAFYAICGKLKEKGGQKIRIACEAFLENKTKEPGVHKLPSGLMFKIQKKGTGALSPGPMDSCEVHYEGTLFNGRKFDSSYDRGRPSTFAPNQVIRGWTEALQLMREGDIWEVYIPYQLGYGASGAGFNIPGYATLVFKMELLRVLQRGRPAAEAQAELERRVGKAYGEL